MSDELQAASADLQVVRDGANVGLHVEGPHEGRGHLRIKERRGPRPATDKRPPHTQLDQLAPPAERTALSRHLLLLAAERLEGTVIGESLRAPAGTIGLHLAPGQSGGDVDAFLIGGEFAHVHARHDGSLHAVLPEPLRTMAMEAGWAEPHPFAGRPTVSPGTVMIYAPRDTSECEMVAELIRCSWLNARAARSGSHAA